MQHAWATAVQSALLAELNTISADWKLDGDVLRQSSTASVIVDQRHDAGPGHVDICIALHSGTTTAID
jgi:hypothetical protein